MGCFGGVDDEFTEGGEQTGSSCSCAPMVAMFGSAEGILKRILPGDQLQAGRRDSKTYVPSACGSNTGRETDPALEDYVFAHFICSRGKF